MRPLFKKSAVEAVTGQKVVLDAIKELSTYSRIAQIDAIAKDAGVEIPPRDHFPFAQIVFPISDELYASCVLAMDEQEYDLVVANAGVRKFSQQGKSALASYSNTLKLMPLSNKYWTYSYEELLEGLAKLENTKYNNAANVVKSLIENKQATPRQALQNIVQMIPQDEYIKMGMSGFEEYEVELAFDTVQKALKDVLEEYADSVPQSSSASSATSTAGLSVEDAVRAMLKTGGEMTVAGKTGYVVEIFYDYSAGKLRARTNDGSRGVMNCRFPNSQRTRDAVFIVPKYEVGLANNCYSISNSVPVANYRVR